MKKTAKEYRKATQEEIENGSPEMILVSETEIECDVENREVELWRIKGVLSLMGRISEIDLALSQLPEPNKTLARLVWENGNTLNSQSDTVKFVQSVFGLSELEKESIFDQAQSIKL